MKHFTGRLNFFRSPGTGTIVALAAHEDFSLPGYIKLGTSDVIHVDFTDSCEAEIESIEAEMKAKAAEHQQWLEDMTGKIESLKAIEHSEVA
mgnify:CR=1 FL=1